MKWVLLGLMALSLHVGAATLPVQDGDFGCIDQAQADSYVRDFGINVESFGGMELCNSNVDTKKLFNDLQLIQQERFSGNTSNLFIRNFVDRDNYFAWMKSETRGMERGNDIPYATAYNSAGYFTMQDGWAKLSTLGRVGTIIHEARHTEGYGHTQCNHGPYNHSFVAGCDESIQEGGAHAIEMEYYARVATQGANLHPVYQEMARLMLLARSNFVFNENPLQQKDALLARTDSGLVQLKNDQAQTFQWESAPTASVLLKRTSFGATLLDTQDDTAYAVSLRPDGTSDVVRDDYSYFKLLNMNPPASLADFEEVDLGTSRYVFALTASGQLYSYIFPQGEWSQPSALSGAERLVTSDPGGNDGIYAVMKDGHYCSLNPARRTCQGSEKAWPANAKSFVKFQGHLLELTQDGQVLENGKAFSDFQGTAVRELVKIPDFNVFESDNLF